MHDDVHCAGKGGRGQAARGIVRKQMLDQMPERCGCSACAGGTFLGVRQRSEGQHAKNRHRQPPAETHSEGRALGHEAEERGVAGEGERGGDKERKTEAAQLRAVAAHHRADHPADRQHRFLVITKACA